MESSMLPTQALEYDLPEALIARHPAEPRSTARLMVVRDDSVEHLRIADLPDLLLPSDALVMNRTSVLPARFVGRNADTGGKTEGLWLGDVTLEGGRPGWQMLLKARRLREGKRVTLLAPDGTDSCVTLRLLGRSKVDGLWQAEVEGAHGRSTPAVLDEVGLTPLPPYIRSARFRAGEDVADARDRADYQTAIARASGSGPIAGSVAAPTAGLHFSPELLGAIDRAGVRRGEVVLHVGAGTFKPVETEYVQQHPMHREWCSLAEAAWALDHPGRVVAVGSTSARTLETFAQHTGDASEGWLETDLLIAPGYAWKRVDALLTNFHLPRSTLLAMVGALVPGGIERLRALYAEAVALEYRFYSYGDAMLIVPSSR
jgi:S-adenosylmethionine:tRNA ribosyltransferase-isomerase